MPKYNLISIFKRYIALLLTISFVCSLVLCLSITFKTKPSEKEKFSLFMDLSYGSVETDNMETKIFEIDSSLKKVDVFSFSPDSSNYNTYFETKGKEADLLLLAKSHLSEKKMDNYIILNDYYKEGYFVDGNLYGLLSKKKENSYFTFLDNEEYYCFFRKDSYHISSIVSSSYDNLAFSVMEEFF